MVRTSAALILAAALAMPAFDVAIAQNPQQPPQAASRRDPATSAAFAGRFRCIWTSPDGFIYECELQLRSAGNTDLEGRIQWTLVRSPRANEQAKIGKSGAELVRGAVEAPGKVTLKGYDKIDPDNILGLDEYRLELSSTARWMFGPTSHHGAWDAHFVALRF